MVHRIQDYKPNLKRSGSPVDTSDSKPALAYDSSSDIIMFSEQSWVSIILNWLKSGLMFLVSALFIFFVLYVTLAATLFFGNLIDGKITFVARGTFLGGQPAVEDYVLSSATEAEKDDPLSRLQYATMGVPNAQVVQIASGPVDIITATASGVTVQGENNASFDQPLYNNEGELVTASNQKLNNQYLALCVAGECEPNTFVIISADNIHGEIQNLKGE